MIDRNAVKNSNVTQRALGACKAPIMAFCLSAAALLTGQPAHAQQMLYENRLPDGYAYVRFANVLPDSVALKPTGITDPLTLGVNGADRVSSYFVVENVAGHSFTTELGGAAASVKFELKPGAYHTVLLEKTASGVVANVVTDQVELSQTKARIAFYNTISDCAAADLKLEPAGQSIFTGIGPNLMGARAVNPVENPKVRATCGSGKDVSIDLGPLDAGGQYSVWLMTPAGAPVAFLSKNMIAPYMR